MGGKRAVMAAALATLCLIWALSSSAHAQEYRFSVPKVDTVVEVKPDASVIIEYRMEFENHPRGHAIDVVDVGMPTKHYEVLSASIDGKPLRSWKPSTYIAAGPEVHLGPHAIRPGAKGVFECRARVTDMVYEDRDAPERASLRFTPTWFGDRYVVGDTDLLLVVTFPQGVHPDSVVWHSNERKFFQKGILEPDKVPFVSWRERYRFTGPMMFGCSFPRAVMQRVVESTWWTRFSFWWEGSKRAQWFSGALLLILFAAFFLLLTRGTGITVLLVCAVVFVVLMIKSPTAHLFLWLLIPAMAGVWYLAVRQGRPHYMPALARVEGGKICRGLSPAEAAVLLDVPLHRVLSMAIAGLLSKGVLRITRNEPFQVEPVGRTPAPNVVQLPDGRKVSLEPYEVGFYATLCAGPNIVSQKDFGEPLKRLVGLVRYKTEGFDAEATRAYYRAVTARAWNQVSQEGDPNRKDDVAARHLNWLLVADDYDDRMETQRAQGWHYRPFWYHLGRYDQDRDWVGHIAKGVTPAADRAAPGLGIAGKGLDLSGVDHFTLDALGNLAKAAASGGSGGGGGGCACACAGCACACACAGGGR